MGAADTLIAKPWRHEVYVQLSAYPHPVLGHELAHVVAGSFGRGPFRIAGSAGGLWPDPGLIEGVAVAASPDDDELTDAQWAHAMLDLGSLPPMASVFSLGFLDQRTQPISPSCRRHRAKRPSQSKNVPAVAPSPPCGELLVRRTR